MTTPLSCAASAARVFAVLCALTTSGFAQTLPNPWRSEDVGSPVLAGSARASAGVFSIDAAGADIAESSDQFHFLYQPIAGDVDVVARIDSLVQVSPWTVAGVMIRGSLAPHAAHAYAAVTAAKGLSTRVRSTDGAVTSSTIGAKRTPPTWLRVIRRGQVLSMFFSSNGSTWTAMGSSTVNLGPTAYVGIAVASRSKSARTTATVSNLYVRSFGLPDGQQSSDIGAPAIAGTVEFASGAYTMTAGGLGLTGTADQFLYVFQPLTGDGEVIARVGAITGTNAAGSAGVMFREALTAHSPYAAAMATRGGGYTFQRRLDPAAPAISTPGGGGTPPGFVRLVRRGDLFEAYRSVDGTTWSLMGQETIVMTETIYVGLASASYEPSSTVVSTVDNLRVTMLAATNRPPAVSLTNPGAGTEVTIPATIQLTAVASDPENRLLAIDFYVGSTLLSRDGTAPYAAGWSPAAAGTYSLTAVAHDADGGTTTSAGVTVVVRPANQAPSVSLSVSGTSFVAPATIGLSASAVDPDGQVARVDFFSGSTLIGSASAAPYSFTWANVPAGGYTLIAVAYDNAGASASSAAVAVRVDPAPTTAPRLVVFTASTDHDANVSNYVLKVFGSNADVATATPVATSDLGKPAPDANRDITVDRLSFFTALPTGTYKGTVTAVGPGGQTVSHSLEFTR